MSILTRSRVVALGLGAGLALATTAFAAVTLSMSIGGTTAIAAADGTGGDGGATDANLRIAAIHAVSEGPADCKASTNGGRDIVLRATVTSSQGTVPEQHCFFRFTVKNEGRTPVRDVRIDFRDDQDALRGWTIEDRSPDTVGADALSMYEIEMTPVSRSAQHLGTGAFTGVLLGIADTPQ